MSGFDWCTRHTRRVPHSLTWRGLLHGGLYHEKMGILPFPHPQFQVLLLHYQVAMDPLSITASIVALVQASAAIGKGVKILRSFRRIPDEFCDLLNELATLQAVAEQVKTALADIEGQTADSGLPFANPQIVFDLRNDLSKVGEDLGALCSRLQTSTKQKQSDEPKTGQKVNVSKLKWHKEKDNIAAIRQKARGTREALNLCLSAFNTSQSLVYLSAGWHYECC